MNQVLCQPGPKSFIAVVDFANDYQPATKSLVDLADQVRADPTKWITLDSAPQARTIPVFADYIADRSDFVGRDHVFARVQEFLANSPSGYLTIIGEPGIGKTAIACELTRRMSCVVHFFIHSEGMTKANQFYAFIGDQLRERFGIDTTSGIDDEPGLRLKRWLLDAAELLDEDKLIFVVDALDECDEVDKDDRAGNLLFLPRLLPKGVYFVLTRRPLDPTHHHIRLETEPSIAKS